MTNDKMISGLPQDSLRSLKDRMTNADRLLVRDPENADAIRLRSAIKAELAQRKMASRKKVGPLWWEPHDPDVPEFFAYETPESSVPVGAIFKHDTHTGTRKEVYSVRIGERELPGRFADVEIARQTGSEAWEDGVRS